MRRSRLVLAGVVALASAPVAAGAQTVPPPAPPSQADAVAAQVQAGGQQVVAVSHTNANATPNANDSSATANVVEAGGKGAPDSHVGGTKKGPGDASGAIADTKGTGFDQLGRVAMAPWEAHVREDAAGRHATAHASVLELTVAPQGNKVLNVKVLTSDAAADHTLAKSTARGSSDALVVELGDSTKPQGGILLDLLHAESSSESGAGTYVLRIFSAGSTDQKIITDKDVAGQCVITIPSVLQLTCASAKGGVGEILQLVLGPSASQGAIADLLRAASSGGAAGPGNNPPAPNATPGPVVLGTEVTLTPQVGSAAAAALPRTGADTARWLGVGLGVLVLGAALGVARRRMALAVAV